MSGDPRLMSHAEVEKERDRLMAKITEYEKKAHVSSSDETKRGCRLKALPYRKAWLYYAYGGRRKFLFDIEEAFSESDGKK
jgi:hypothetical protein